MAPINVSQAVETAFKDHLHHRHPHAPLSPPDGTMYLAGPDEFITYHYLKAETSRNLPLDEVEGFNNLPKNCVEDFVCRRFESDIRGSTRSGHGHVDPRAQNPRADDRDSVSYTDYTDLVFEKSGVGKVYMTNDPLIRWRVPIGPIDSNSTHDSRASPARQSTDELARARRQAEGVCGSKGCRFVLKRLFANEDSLVCQT